eukprot:2662021-Lingulodinium_polyedra.AAC.1
MGSYPMLQSRVLAVPPMPTLRLRLRTGPTRPPTRATTLLSVTRAPTTFRARSGRFRPTRTSCSQ